MEAKEESEARPLEKTHTHYYYQFSLLMTFLPTSQNCNSVFRGLEYLTDFSEVSLNHCHQDSLERPLDS